MRAQHYHSNFEEDDFDDIDIGRGRRRPLPSSVGRHALVLGLIGLACVVLIGGVSVSLAMVGMERGLVQIWAIVLLSYAGFLLSLIGVILGIRAQNQTIPAQRHMGIAGMMLGILVLIATFVAGGFFTCLAVLFELARNAGG